METRPLSDLIAALRNGDPLMQEAADALMANQGAIVNSIIERTRHEVPEPSTLPDYFAPKPMPQVTFADRLSARSDYELGRMAGRDEIRAELEERKKNGVWVEHAGHCNAEPQGEPSAPDGWFVFGSHAPYPWAGKMEFSAEQDEAGMPLWERPVQGEPSDDEREAITDEGLWDFASDLLDAWSIDDLNPPSLLEDFRDRFVRRFRSSEVPEPTADQHVDHHDDEPSSEVPEPSATARPCHLPQSAPPCIGCRCEPQGEPSDAIPDEDQIAADNADWHTEYTEPRPEPSDAEVLAALNAYYGGKPPVSDAFKDSMSMNMRAALRAAWSIR